MPVKQQKEKKLRSSRSLVIQKNNPLSRKGNLNLWVNSKAYNYVENTQIWLLAVCDLIIGKTIYPASKKR